MKILDIPGAQVNTLKKGISTNRVVNPVWPFNQYQYLGMTYFFVSIYKLNRSERGFGG